ncbi:hypothetical protein [Type-E symbiont of Plautia stali]|uniref:hypothetical protein n=1 Tax=Type-E symbiont of Plautia stali TaxID=1560357 RepID=UPI00073F664E|nr:hypothetical protein [Type-E symbiont of Plautia stali]
MGKLRAVTDNKGRVSMQVLSERDAANYDASKAVMSGGPVSADMLKLLGSNPELAKRFADGAKKLEREG